MNNASTIKRVFFVGVLVLSHTISARHIPSLLYTDFCTASELTLVKEWQVRRSYIAIVRDKKGNEYIVKQAKEKLAAADMFAIRDAMGAWMAEELDIPANRVRIIPAGVAVPGKMYVDRPATIHRLIKNGIHYDIRMPKYMRTFMQRLQKTVKRIRQFSLRQEYGRAPRDQRGLTLRIIKSMICEDFARIVALDCLLGISDRGRSNMLYVEKENKFYFIDFDITYSKDLCIWAAEQLAKLAKRPSQLSAADYRSLMIYGKTLETLVKKYTPEYVAAFLNHLCQEANINYSKENKDKISFIQYMAGQSYESAKKVLHILDRLLSHARAGYSGRAKRMSNYVFVPQSFSMT